MRCAISLDEFEAFITDSLYQEKLMQRVCSDQAVQGVLQTELAQSSTASKSSHIVLDSESKAKEMLAVLREDPDRFEEMAREHSTADTRERGGLIGKGAARIASVRRRGQGIQCTPPAICWGPFASKDRTAFEVFRVNAMRPARLDDDTANRSGGGCCARSGCEPGLRNTSSRPTSAGTASPWTRKKLGRSSSS